MRFEGSAKAFPKGVEQGVGDPRQQLGTTSFRKGYLDRRKSGPSPLAHRPIRMKRMIRLDRSGIDRFELGKRSNERFKDIDDVDVFDQVRGSSQVDVRHLVLLVPYVGRSRMSHRVTFGEMKTGWIGAVVGGAVGALVWAAIARFLHMEIGYVAWGVGFAVGFGSALLGGCGLANGIFCSLTCLLSIFAGKVLAVHWSLTPEDLRKEISANPNFAEMPAAQVDEAVRFAQTSWTWRDSIEAAKSDLGPFDLLFAGLGVVTAFQLGRQSETSGPSSPTGQDPPSYDPIPNRVEPESDASPKP